MIAKQSQNKNTKQTLKFSDSLVYSLVTVSRREAGFTLIEMMVVMSVTAIIFSLGAFAMMSANRQNQVLAAAREFQSTVRQAANESITVSNATGTTISAKAWSVAVTSGAGEYSLDSYYPASVILSGATTASLTKSQQTTNLQGNIMMTVSVEGTAYSNDETLNLIFSSPFAKFDGSKGALGTVTVWDISSSDEATYGGGTSETGKATITFSNGNTALDVKVTVDLETGETSI